MDIRELFGVNVEKAKAGTWIPFGDTFSILARRADENNTEFQLAKTKAFSDTEFNRRMQMNLVTQKELNVINAQLWADHIVMDWKGVELDGEAVPFSKENFVKIMTMDCMIDFIEMIQLATINRRNFAWESPEKK